MYLNFNPQIIHIHGNFGIHSYGLLIAIGIIIAIWAIKKDKRFSQLHLQNVFLDIITMTVIVGCIGGRVLAIISEPYLYQDWYDWFALWKGGFSTLGSILGIIIVMPFYLKKIHVPILPLFDLVSIYAPLMQSIGRLGCLCAGCCYGVTTNQWYGITYTHPHSLAPLNISIHPTQIYSSLILFMIFLLMFFIARHYVKKDGQLFVIYLICMSLERFFIDFWRADRVMIINNLSFHQIVALCIIITIIIVHCLSSITTKTLR